MVVETAADRATLLADFGESVTFTPGSSYPNRNDNTASIVGIFDNGFWEIAGEETRADSLNPTLLVKTAETVNAARNSMIETAAAVYKVVGVEPDGTGLTLLILEGPK